MYLQVRKKCEKDISSVDLYIKVCRAVMVDHRVSTLLHATSASIAIPVRKMCRFAAPPGYRRTPAPVFSMLVSFVAIIDTIPEADTAKSM
jgi:hypothetical protein